MKILVPLLLSFTASTALAHSNHDDSPMVPLKPGTRVQESSTPPLATVSNAEVAKPVDGKADNEAKQKPGTKPAANNAAPKP